MATIIDVEIAETAQPAGIPQEGYYVELHYMYGDADGYNDVTAGPFPNSKKHLLIELLNILEAMLASYPNGKGGWDGYSHVPGYDKWFDPDYDAEKDGKPDPDAEFREELGLETECTSDGYGCIAKFTGYDIWHHDGKTLDKYNVTPKYA